MIFIRPWFLVLLFVPLLLWLFKGKLASSSVLSKYIDEHLLPFVTVHFGNLSRPARSRLFLFVWISLVIAGAGPAYEKVSVPVKVSAPAHVIVMDMSPAMTGETLQTAKRKLYDLLSALKGHQVGLVIYDEKGYVVSPLTQDLNIIRTMIPALQNNIMPTYGNRADLAFEKAADLFKNVEAKEGQIIFLTAGGYDAGKLKKTTQKLPFKIATIGFGSNENKPVSLPDGRFLRTPEGALVFSGLNEDVLKELGTYVNSSVNDEDIQTVLTAFSPTEQQQGQPDSLKAEVWHDLGPLLLLIIAPFFAFLFRRGTIYIFILGILTMGFGRMAEAQVSTWFLRSDQQQYKVLQQGVQAYHAQKFKEANKAFESLKDTPYFRADALYNKGNALAHLNDIHGAILAYETALKFNPNHAYAKFNKEYLQKQLQPEQQDQDNRDNTGHAPPQEKKDEQNKADKSEELSNNEQQTKGDGKDNQTQKEGESVSEEGAQGVNNQAPVSSEQMSAPESIEPGQKQNNPYDNTSHTLFQNVTQTKPQEVQKTSQTASKNASAQGSGALNNPDEGMQAGPMSFQTQEIHTNLNKKEEAKTPPSVNVPPTQQTQIQKPRQPNPNQLKEDISSYGVDPLSGTSSAQPFDQEATQLLNRIRQDPSRLLRYRLYQQWRQQND